MIRSQKVIIPSLTSFQMADFTFGWKSKPGDKYLINSFQKYTKRIYKVRKATT